MSEANKRETKAPNRDGDLRAPVTPAQVASGETPVNDAVAAKDDRPALTDAPAMPRSASSAPPARLGHYRIIDPIGRGGMGEVFKAYDESLDRTVAIKMLRPDLARSSEFVDRFRTEASAAAKLSHPNVIPIHFIGADAGWHYFVMQYVEGESLADRLKRKTTLPESEAVKIALDCADGLQAAHEHGLVHRDIKPGNILLDRKHGRAIVADFGLVKALDADRSRTSTGAVLGSIEYMAPEQGRAGAIDARADLYSLGVVLYQMLSGQLPFEAEDASALLFLHAYQPPPLEAISSGINPELRDLVEQLLAKAPEDRPQNAEALRTELIRIAKAIRARDAERPAARQKTSITMAPQFGALPELPSIASCETPQGRLERLRDRAVSLFQRQVPKAIQESLLNTQQQLDGVIAERRRRERRLKEALAEAEQVDHDLRHQLDQHRAGAGGDGDERAELSRLIHLQAEQLELIRSNLAKERAVHAQLRSQRDLLVARLRTAEARQQVGAAKPRRRLPRLVVGVLSAVAIATVVAVLIDRHQQASIESGPIGESSADVARNKFVRLTDAIIDVKEGNQGWREIIRGVFSEHSNWVTDIAFYEEDRSLLTASADGTINYWSLTHGVGIRTVDSSGSAIEGLATSLSGRRFVYLVDGSILSREHPQAPSTETLALGADLFTLEFLGTGQSLMTLERNGHATAWEPNSSTKLSEYQIPASMPLLAATWPSSSDSPIVAARASNGKGIAIIGEGGVMAEIDPNRSGAVNSIAISSSGKLAVLLGERGASVWDLATVTELRDLNLPIDAGNGIARFSPDGGRILTADASGSSCVIDWRKNQVVMAFDKRSSGVTAAAFGGLGRLIAVGEKSGVVHVEAVPRPFGALSMRRERAPIRSIAFRPDGARCAFATHEGHIENVIVQSFDAPGGAFEPLRIALSTVAVSADGESYVAATATAAGDNYVSMRMIRPTVTHGEREVRRFKGSGAVVHSAAFSPDGRYVAAGSEDGTIRLFEVQTEKEIERIEIGSPVRTVAYSPDGTRIVSGGNDKFVRQWNAADLKELTRCEGHTFHVLSAVYVGGNDKIASASADGTARLWNASTGKAIGSFEGHGDRVNAIAATSDGKRVITGCEDWIVRLFDVERGKLRSEYVGHCGPVYCVAISPDDTKAISGGNDRFAIMWDLTKNSEVQVEEERQ